MRRLVFTLLSMLVVPAFAGDWRLAGTLTHGEGLALLATDGGQQMFRPGDTLPLLAGEPGPCRLADVRQRSVLLQCADGPRQLGLDGQPAPIEDTHQFGDTHVSGRPLVLEREAVREIIEDRQRLVREVPLEPVTGEGGLTGYRLLASAAGSLPERIGFAAGDIIRSVNGVGAETGGAFMRMLNDLGEARQLRIGYERAGSRREILIVLEAVSAPH